jgi:hypothetical protein
MNENHRAHAENTLQLDPACSLKFDDSVHLPATSASVIVENYPIGNSLHYTLSPWLGLSSRRHRMLKVQATAGI